MNILFQMYLNRLIREDRDRQIERISNGKEYSQVENEVSDVEMTAVIYISCNWIIFYSINILFSQF